MPSFNYFDVPIPTNNPSTDAPNMRTNFSSIQSLVDVDHTDFANMNAGTHLQVQFGTNNTPGGFALPTLFTKLDTANNPQLFYYATSAAASQNQYVLNALGSNKGSVLLMGGVILKWFTGTLTTPTQEFDFAAGGGIVLGLNNFPNTVQGAMVTTQTFISGGYIVGYQSLSTTNIVVQRNPGAGGSTNVFVVVIGT